MKEKRVILFDLGNVLIDFDHRTAVNRIRKHCALGEEEIYNLFFDSDVTDRYERGLITSLEFFRELKHMLHASISYNEFVPIWNDIFFAHPGMLEVLYALKGTYDLYMVSNINELHYLYLKEMFPNYFNCFKKLFLSYQLKMRKPDPEIYAHIIFFLRLSAHQIIYVDDRPELVEAAKKLHIDAFAFESTDACRETLAEHDIIFTTPVPLKR